MNCDKEMGIGVIGVGGRGALAQHAHRPDEGVRLVAGADTSTEALAGFADRLGPDVFTTDDYRKLLARPNVDAVFITSPDYCHAEHAIAALTAGKAVFLEKPLAITIADCDSVLRAARDNKGKLYVGHNMRHLGFVRKMRQLIDAGVIGQVKAAWCRHFVAYGGDAYFKDWHAERKYSTGLLLQKASHDIDVLHWLCGGYTTRVTAMGKLTLYDQVADRHAPSEKGNAELRMENWPPLTQTGLNPVIDVEDLSMMLMELDNGVLASYQQCHYAPDAWRNYTVIGTAGRIENFGDEAGKMVVRVWNTRTSYNPYGDQQYFIQPDEGAHGGADPKIVAEFIRYVRRGAAITTSAVGARNSVAAGCRATESLRSGGTPMDVPPLEEELAGYFDAGAHRP